MYLKIFFVIILAVLVKQLVDYMINDDSNTIVNPDKETETTTKPPPVKPQIFTLEQFEHLTSKEKKLYLAILGNVYDVTKGEKHYKPGGSYDFFIGKDASRSYVTGDFKNDLNDNIDGLTDTQVADLFNWKKFYDETYKHLGVLIGRFYDENGAKTTYLLDAEHKERKDLEVKKQNTKFNERFPPCNTEWKQDIGVVNVWCTTESGGVKRSWTGVPRLVFNPNSNVEACACVNEADLGHSNVKEYPKCDPKATSCNPSQK